MAWFTLILLVIAVVLDHRIFEPLLPQSHA
jgi:hypothetical protein